MSEGPAGTQYSMEEPEARQVMAPSAASDVAFSSCDVSFYICLYIQLNFSKFCVLVNVFWLHQMLLIVPFFHILSQFLLSVNNNTVKVSICVIVSHL